MDIQVVEFVSTPIQVHNLVVVNWDGLPLKVVLVENCWTRWEMQLPPQAKYLILHICSFCLRCGTKQPG